jgi:serine/threonine-protein kinase
MVGKTIANKYRIVKLLGEGGMGAVYQGEQQMGTKTRPVAIKTLHPHLSKDPKVRARFDREVGTIAELEHPNTIQVYDFGTTEDGLLYLVMEFINGTNVADMLEKHGAMEPQRVEKIMTQVCGSLEEAHSRGIIHRDLKPENVVLTERAGQKDFVKVLDFGIAKRSNEEDKQEQKLTQQGMVLGTPPYMSPEQFTGKPIDVRSDIYSLGVMMYEMLTGRLPFNANTAWEWATQHMTVPPIAIESSPNGAQVPQQMRTAIMKSLEKDPNGRWSTVREFADAFHGATAGMAPMSLPRPGTAPLPAGGGGVAMSSGPATPPSAVPAPPDNQKGKTQMGEPLMAPGAFGGPPGPPPGAAPPAYGAPAPIQGTPSAGNLAVPAIPAGPSRDQGGGGGSKTGILAALGIIGLLSIGAIAYAVMPHGKSSAGGLDLDAGSDPTPVNLTATASSADNTPPTLDTGIATLSTKPIPAPPHPGGQTHHDGGAAPQPHPSGGGTTPPGPGPTPPGPGPTPPGPGPKPVSPETQAACATAKRLQNNPNNGKDPAITNMFNSARAQCLSGGGSL